MSNLHGTDIIFMYGIYANINCYDKSRNHDSFRLGFKHSIFIFLSGVKVSIKLYWCFMIYQLRRMRVLWAPRIYYLFYIDYASFSIICFVIEITKKVINDLILRYLNNLL